MTYMFGKWLKYLRNGIIMWEMAQICGNGSTMWENDLIIWQTA